MSTLALIDNTVPTVGDIQPEAFILPADVNTVEDLECLLVSLNTRLNGSQWAIAAALNQADTRLGTEAVEQAARVLRRSATTLNRWMAVEKRIPYERRRLELTFSHHAAVAYCDPIIQDAILQMAVEHDWDEDSVAQEVRERKEQSALPKVEREKPVIIGIAESRINELCLALQTWLEERKVKPNTVIPAHIAVVMAWLDEFHPKNRKVGK